VRVFFRVVWLYRLKFSFVTLNIKMSIRNIIYSLIKKIITQTEINTRDESIKLINP
jgi:hypothetical protein